MNTTRDSEKTMSPAEAAVNAAVGEAELAKLAEAMVQQARENGVELTGDGGLLTALTRQVMSTALEVEMSDHLGYEKHDRAGHGSGNSRNGTSTKTVHTEIGAVQVPVPRDRNGTFEPVIVPKHARRLSGFEAAVVSLYAKGMTCGDIVNHLQDIYGQQVSKDLVSQVTDAILAEMQAWASRPLDRVYPVILIDAIMVKIREGNVANRPIYVAMGIDIDGRRDVLGLWAGQHRSGEGAKQWMSMLTDLRNRGVQDVCIVCCDGLQGLPEAINAVWPLATTQTCVVHLIRNSIWPSPRSV